jgi:CRISPR-associated endonuclease Cas1
MASSKTLSQVSQYHNRVESRFGVLVLFGYPIEVFVERGHLILRDGIGPDRRHFRLSRVGHNLQRLVILGAHGFISLSALEWLSNQKVSFSMLERDGQLLAATGPVYASDARLRRSQSLAHQSDLALRIARELITRKLAGQEKVARIHLLDNQTADRISQYREELVQAEDSKRVRLIEAHAAGLYWGAYQTLPVNFPRKDESRIPEHWKRFGNRASPLTGSPRKAANPANAILNYAYALLESESRLAVATLGLDPGLGFLHNDAPGRDSLACDLMEASRPAVDSWFVDWITKETLRRDWFFEQKDGGCRLMANLTEKISETSPIWARAIAPTAEWVASTLWSSVRTAPSDRHPATRLTQRRRSEGRGSEYIQNTKAVPHPKNICAGCGISTKRGLNCPKCGREIARAKLIELAKIGRIVGHSPASIKKQAEKQRLHEQAKRAWRSMPKPSWPTEQDYSELIQPRLASVTIAMIARTLAISEPYAAMIRSGKYRPHPRHWEVLAKLVDFPKPMQRVPAAFSKP